MSTTPPLLSCHSLTKSFGDKPLFRDLTIGLTPGTRLGIIGPNGSGKSTLLKMLMGRAEPDRGDVVRSRNLLPSYLEQQKLFEKELTITETLNREISDSPLAENDRTRRVQSIVSKMGFNQQGMFVGGLSGGWLKRLAIGCELIKEPNLLIMDEPTNHLDLEGIAWLEELVQKEELALVIVTHDRLFLENVATSILEINRRYPQGYYHSAGNYSQFLERRADFIAGLVRQEASLSNRVRNEIEWLRRGPKARTTKAEARIKEATRLMGSLQESRERSQSNFSLNMEFTASGRRTKRLVVAESISLSRGGKQLFRDLNFVLAPGVRLGILGRNGAGKSSLLKVISGELEIDSGKIERSFELKILTLAQDRLELFNSNQSLARFLAPDSDSVVYRDRSFHIASYAARFGFDGRSLQTPVNRLSGGEQARLAIARLMLAEADVLLLDEPTNDLDLDSLELLEEGLEDFPGAIVLISHDRMLLDRVSTSLVGLHDGGECAVYADVGQWLEKQKSLAPQGGREQLFQGFEQEGPTEEIVEKKKSYYREKKELAQVEKQIERTEKRISELEFEMAQPQNVTDANLLLQLNGQLQELRRENQALYLRWEELYRIMALS